MKHRIRWTLLLGFLISINSSGFIRAEDAQTGTFSGVVRFEGKPPVLPPLVKKNDAETKDAAVCAASTIPDESLVVNKESKGIANVFVYLRKRPENLPEDDGKAAKKLVVLEQKGCRYVPHATIVRTNQKLKVVSRDKIAHNAHIYTIQNPPVGIIISPKGEDQPWEFHQPEPIPSKMICDIHPWMSSWVLIVDHPFAAVTGEDGEFEIDGLPAGKYEFRFWQEKAGWLEKSYKVTIEAGQESEVNLNYTTKDFEE